MIGRSAGLVLILLWSVWGQAQSLKDLDWGTDSTLEVASWNIERFPKRGNATIDSVGKIIAAMDIDVWALQEIDDTNDLKRSLRSLPDYKAVFGKVYFRGLAYVYNTKTVKNAKVSQLFTQSQYRNPLPRAPLVLEFEYQDSTIRVINNHYKCCGNGSWDRNDPGDEESRRYAGHRLIMDYVNLNWFNERVMVVGDLNDLITDPQVHNIFQQEIDDTNYYFVDMPIAQSSSANWSYPSWPSHLDHILINKPLLSTFSSPNQQVSCVKVDDYLNGGWNDYDYYISDHRPVAYRFALGVAQDQDTTKQDTALGINLDNLAKESAFRIFPNPSTSNSRLEWQKDVEVSRIVVKEMSGKTIQDISINPRAADRSIPLQLPRAGWYWVQCFHEGEVLDVLPAIVLE
ncbi:endonuclease/exonuclease/phosphatase family protein [bacterium SCSIO 12741]|nr:endonuclease/exonuclease/phosphatase family protein [bacterium SCSIO 12741]